MTQSPQQTALLNCIPYSCTIVGKVRDHNEDAVIALDANSSGQLNLQAMLAVADGMGGHQRGEWASATALKAVTISLALAAENTPVENALRDAVINANKTIFSEAPETGSSQGQPGTTLTIAAIKGNTCHLAQVGDSRAYLLRGGAFKVLTEDDTWAAELVRQGKMSPAEAANWTHRNQLTKAVGVKPEVEPSLKSVALQLNDILLLCSDGLHGMISNSEIYAILQKSSSIVEAGEALCAAANNAGGEDNITVALYAHGSWAPREATPPTRRASTKEMPRQAVPLNGLPRASDNLGAMLPYLIITVIAFLLGAGLRFVTYHPAHATKNSQAAVSDASIRLDMKDGKLLVSGQNCTVTGQPSSDTNWDTAQASYTFVDFVGSENMLDNGEAQFILQGPNGALPLTMQAGHSWTAAVTAAGNYSIIWSKDGKTRGFFSVTFR